MNVKIEISSFCGKQLIGAFHVFTWARLQIHFGNFILCSEHWKMNEVQKNRGDVDEIFSCGLWRNFY
jgi:hypothetical protein